MQTGMIDSTTSTTGTTGTSATTASNTLDKDAFLKLLVAQLKNQDPTNTQDPNAMVAQMAQFSSLEQQQNTNTLLSGMQTQVSALFQGQSASLIGKKVQVTSSSMDLSGGAASVGVNLPAAATVALSVQDATGKTVAVLNQGTMAAGTGVVKWDGKDSNGNQLADGTYTVKIAAVGTDGKAVDATTTAFATVTAVSYTNGIVSVTAGGQTYPLSAVNEVTS